MTRKLIIGILLLSVLAGCNKSSNTKALTTETKPLDTVVETNPDLVGSWIQPNPINKKEVQGLELMNGGEAKSINMATYLYKNWWLKDKQLHLVVESIGNGTSSIDTLAYDIIKVDKDSLVIKHEYLQLSYKRK